MKAIVEGQEVGIGDYVCFKCDIEQGAEIIEINRDLMGRTQIRFKAPPNGFDGDYIRNSEYHTELASECWL